MQKLAHFTTAKNLHHESKIDRLPPQDLPPMELPTIIYVVSADEGYSVSMSGAYARTDRIAI